MIGADELIEEDGVDEGGRGLPAGSVGQRDDIVGEPWTAAAERRDAVEHRRFAGGVGRCRQPRSATDDGEAILHRGPQGERQGPLRLLDAVHALGGDDEAVLDIVGASHVAAVVAGEPDRQHAT